MTVQEIALAQASPDLGEGAARLRRNALVAGGVALALGVVGAFWAPAAFFRGYLLGFLFWLGVALGSLPLMMLHHLSSRRRIESPQAPPER
jgi:hypothetical protein